MSPRLDVSEERRGQILEAALRVFSRQGFHKARMDDIVEEAGVSKGLLYWYFKGKDAVITALLEKLFAGSITHISDLVQEDGPASARLHAATLKIADDMARMMSMLPITFEFYSLATRNKTVKEFLRSYYESYRSGLVALIQQGVASGEFRQLDTTAAANTLMGLYEGLLILLIVDADAFEFRTQIEASVEIVIRGLRANPQS